MHSVSEGRGGSALHFETTSEFQYALCVCVWKTLAGMPEFHSVHQECWLKRITEEDRGIKQGTFWFDSALWPVNGVLSVVNHHQHHVFSRIHVIYVYAISLLGYTMAPFSPLQLQLSCCLCFKSYYWIRQGSSCSLISYDLDETVKSITTLSF